MTVKKTKKRYFLSFVGEGIFNPVFYGYVGGRCEVYDNSDTSPYAINEIPFLTKKQRKFNAFREKWDFKDVTGQELEQVECTLKEEFQDYSLCGG